MNKLNLWIGYFAGLITNSLVWFTPWSLLVLTVMPPSYQCWLAERNLGTTVAEWVGEQFYCTNFASPSFDVTIPLWGIILVPVASLVTGFIKKTDAWNPILRLALSAVGLWLYLAIPLYFLSTAP